MGTKLDATTTPRATKTKNESDNIAGGQGTTRRKSEGARYQYFGTDGASSTRKPTINITGTPNTGGIIDHLIGEYQEQVAAKKAEIDRLKDEIAALTKNIQDLQVVRASLLRSHDE